MPSTEKFKKQKAKFNRRPKHEQRLLADYAMQVGGKADAVGLKLRSGAMPTTASAFAFFGAKRPKPKFKKQNSKFKIEVGKNLQRYNVWRAETLRRHEGREKPTKPILNFAF